MRKALSDTKDSRFSIAKSGSVGRDVYSSQGTLQCPSTSTFRKTSKKNLGCTGMTDHFHARNFLTGNVKSMSSLRSSIAHSICLITIPTSSKCHLYGYLPIGSLIKPSKNLSSFTPIWNILRVHQHYKICVKPQNILKWWKFLPVTGSRDGKLSSCEVADRRLTYLYKKKDSTFYSSCKPLVLVWFHSMHGDTWLPLEYDLFQSSILLQGSIFFIDIKGKLCLRRLEKWYWYISSKNQHGNIC